MAVQRFLFSQHGNPTAQVVVADISEINDNLNITFPLSVEDGGTGATTALAARTNLGLEIGVDVQAASDDLTDLVTQYFPATASSGANIHFHEGTDNGTNRVNVTAPATLGSNVTATLPSATGTLLTDTDIGTTVQAQSAVLDATTASFTTADETKLDGIEELADVTDEANVIAALDGATVPSATPTTSDKILLQDADDNDELKQATIATILALATSGSPGVCEGRITLTSGTPISAVLGNGSTLTSSTIYFTPYQGNKIGLYNGSSWDILSFTELSLSVPATTNTMYDLYIYNDAGTPTLESTAWTNDTTRATELTLQDGIEVKTGDTTRRYLGSFRTTSVSGTVSMDQNGMFVWNRYNKVFLAQQINYVGNGGTNYTITSNVGTRQIGGVTTFNSIPYITGIAERDVLTASLTGFELTTSTITGNYSMGFGNNSTSTIQVASCAFSNPPASTSQPMPTTTTHTLSLGAVGLRTIYALENCNRSAGTFTVTYNTASFATGCLKITLPM